MSIEVRNITKTFGNFTALSDVSLDIPTGELVALLGPSGCGKTTLLRIIAGLEVPDSGTILFDGEDATRRTVKERRVGFVFQHYALFRHMTIFENIAFGLRVKPRSQRLSRAAIREKVDALLKLVQLDWLADHYPSQLSGGQRQRVALARALAVEPKILLLDEPFGALDAQVRKGLRRWLRRLHDEMHITSVFVTHDQEEALEVADRVAVIDQGKVLQVGTPEEVYHRPASPVVYKFLGNVNLFRGRVQDGRAYLGDMGLEIPGGASPNGRTASIYVRPHQLEIDLKPIGTHSFRAFVKHLNPAGPVVKVDLESAWGDSFTAELSQERYEKLQLERNSVVFVRLRESRIYVEEART